MIRRIVVRQTVHTRARNRKQWLVELIQYNGWTHGAELGVAKGKTLFYLLNHCPHLHMIGVDLWAEQPGNPGLEDYTQPHWRHKGSARLVKWVAKKSGRAVIIQDYTVAAADQVQDASLDFVFIDADHNQAGADIEAWKSKLKPGGKLMGHDIDWPQVKADVDRLIVNYVVGPQTCWMAK